jgi:hypothetical protein
MPRRAEAWMDATEVSGELRRGRGKRRGKRRRKEEG